MKIINIVCSGDLLQAIPFQRLEELAPDSYKYDPEQYHGAYILISGGKVTLYRSGKYIIYGLKSLDQIDGAYQEFLSIIAPIIDCAAASDPASAPKVQNIVGMEDFGIPINLSRFVIAEGMEQVEYEPEQFPGIVYRGEMGTALLFSSGKVIFPGFKDVETMEAFAADLKEKVDRI
ncbi:MAG: hypothetical protein D5R99_09125 [Methanocalculus sp. MSAO_Arc1]|uniref:hypothetical protein n=1 Tax=Methanocalculus sp. MSAO_Arc1 TaxID=2293854 RepID=UPI000FF0E7B2|nr:hypothetical protein [Methanocalculus sp. MSAO_Arc1]RQD79044.1 MAG: hypothetical protein D5R99_09125 [Methanocalculus sp. MSAO_Arc1]